jgi:hypothetical protein
MQGVWKKAQLRIPQVLAALLGSSKPHEAAV